MGYDVNGNHSRLPGSTVVAGTEVLASRYNADQDDTNQSLNQTVLRDGRTPFTAAQSGVAGTDPNHLVIKSQIDSISSSSNLSAPSGRLSVASGVPITASDSGSVNTLYFVPFNGNSINIASGVDFIQRNFAEKSLSLSSSQHLSGNNYDVFAYWNGADVIIGSGPAWATLTSRGAGSGTTEVESFKGTLVNKNTISLWNGSILNIPPRQAVLIGSFRTIANGITADTKQFRYVSCAINAVHRDVLCSFTSVSWVHSGDFFTVSGGSFSNAIFALQSIGGRIIDIELMETYSSSLNTAYPFVGIGVNTASIDSSIQRHSGLVTTNGGISEASARIRGVSDTGVSVYYPLERVTSPGAASVTWFGGGPGTRLASAISGIIVG